jgi:molybdate transport system permease protein
VLRVFTVAACALMVLFIVVPLAALYAHTSPAVLVAALAGDTARSALLLSLVTTAISLAITLLLGTPLAYVLARRVFPGRALVDAIVDLPIVVPPAVAGLALLFVFGRNGITHLGLAFTTAAVVLAQTFVSAPFYVRAARAGFLAVPRALEDASATLGSGLLMTVLRVSIPIAMPALAGGAMLAWARALGEFGATLMFAGNLQGVTQTLPLAVYVGLSGGDLNVATALSVVLVSVALVVVFAVHATERRTA